MADATAKAETTQALFCAIADYIGLSHMPDPTKKVKEYMVGRTKYDDVATYGRFKQWYAAVHGKNGKPKIEAIFKKIVDANASFAEVEAVLYGKKGNKVDPAWYLSSLRIATELLKKLHTISPNFKSNVKDKGWSEIIYRRAGKKGLMVTIGKLYSEANKGATAWNKANPDAVTPKVTFGDQNKWSPADIYWATPAVHTILKTELEKAKKKPYSFGELNKSICGKIASGELLPLSLKKNESGSINIVKVNFKRSSELKAVADMTWGPQNPERWTTYKGKNITGCKVEKGGQTTLTTGPATGRRDVMLYIKDGTRLTGQYIKIRHDASGSGAIKCQIFEATGPAAGALGETGLANQMNMAAGNRDGTAWLGKYKAANAKYLQQTRSTSLTFPDGEGGRISMKAMYDEKERRKAADKLKIEKYVAAGHDEKSAKARVSLEGGHCAGAARFAVHAGNLSGELVANVSISGLVAWFNAGKKNGVTDTFIQNMYLFATSRSESSARFVIGK